MLFIDYGEPETVVIHRFLDQRVRTDDDLRLAAGDGRECGTARAAPQPTGQQLHSYRKIADQGPHRIQMLLGQNLRRRHERGLIAVLHRAQHGHQRDDRLSCANVPLQQPVHPARRGHVGTDLRQDPALRLGQFERERIEERSDQRVPPFEADPAHLAALLEVRTRMQQLEIEQLVEGQAAAAHLHIAQALRAMQRAEGDLQIGQLQRLPKFYR